MITVNLYYKGQNGAARAFADEMEKSGIADAIRAEEGNLRYQYFRPLDDPEIVLLIDSWTDLCLQWLGKAGRILRWCLGDSFAFCDDLGTWRRELL